METKKYRFDEVTINHDKKRKPLSAQQRAKMRGRYRYFGAQNVIDYVNNYLFDGEYLLIAEDGENLKSGKQNIAQIVEGQFWLNNHAHIVQTNELCNIRYLEYWLNATDISAYITGSAQPKLSQSNMNAMEIELPERIIQDKIVNILSSFDKKIEVNNQINRNLSEQAQAIYEFWFVSFEKFGGVVPLDWDNGVLGDIAEIKTTSFKPDKEPSVLVEHYSIPALDEKHFPVFELAEGIKSNKYLLNKNSVMISKLNPDTKRIWRPLCLSDKPVCSTEFIVFEAKNKKNKDFIFSILDSDKFSNHLCSHVTGSTGSRQRAVPKATLDFKVLIPPQGLIEQFCSIVTPIYDLIGVNEIENQRLSKLRDSLLLKLMSGELDVSNLDI